MRLSWLAALLLIPIGSSQAADLSTLWNIVNGQCVPHEQQDRDPSPCSDVDLADGIDKGYAVLKDIVGVAQFLLIPTTRLSGIEDPDLLQSGIPNYWADAWEARYFVEERVQTTLPRDGIALAINSAAGRTQNQLHIHIDCIRPDIRSILAANREKIGTMWAPFPVPLAGHAYKAIRIAQDSLVGIDPFRMLADFDPKADLGRYTLVLVGETFADGTDGFILLAGHTDPATGNRGTGEELLDHSCAIAGKLG